MCATIGCKIKKGAVACKFGAFWWGFCTSISSQRFCKILFKPLELREFLPFALSKVQQDDTAKITMLQWQINCDMHSAKCSNISKALAMCRCFFRGYVVCFSRTTTGRPYVMAGWDVEIKCCIWWFDWVHFVLEITKVLPFANRLSSPSFRQRVLQMFRCKRSR